MSSFSDLPPANPRDFAPIFLGFDPTRRRVVVLLPGNDTMNVATIIVTRVDDVEKSDQQITLLLPGSSRHTIDTVTYRKGAVYATTGDDRPCAVVVDTADGSGIDLFLRLCEGRYPNAVRIND